MKLPNDPFVLELLPEFIEDWIDKIENEYPNLYTSRDSESLYRLAHTIKGSSYQFGFVDLGDLGVEMMRQVKSEDWNGLEQNKELFRTKLVEIKEYLSNQ